MPWIYLGMMYSSFCWHYEDLSLFSLNYMHTGGSKIWYGVPSSDRRKLERVTKSKLAALHDNDKNFLLDITLQVSPSYLSQNGVSSIPHAR